MGRCYEVRMILSNEGSSLLAELSEALKGTEKRQGIDGMAPAANVRTVLNCEGVWVTVVEGRENICLELDGERDDLERAEKKLSELVGYEFVRKENGN